LFLLLPVYLVTFIENIKLRRPGDSEVVLWSSSQASTCLNHSKVDHSIQCHTQGTTSKLAGLISIAFL